MNRINWIFEQNNSFGLDGSTKKGIFHDYEFDIRYDCVQTKTKPNCGLVLWISKSSIKIPVRGGGMTSCIDHRFGNSVEELVSMAEEFLQQEADKFNTNQETNPQQKDFKTVAAEYYLAIATGELPRMPFDESTKILEFFKARQ